MNAEQIALVKQELIQQATKVINAKQAIGNSQSDAISLLSNLSNRLRDTQPFAEELTAILNQILQKHHFDLGKEEQDQLLSALQPTIIELIQKQMLGGD